MNQRVVWVPCRDCIYCRDNKPFACNNPQELIESYMGEPKPDFIPPPSLVEYLPKPIQMLDSQLKVLLIFLFGVLVGFLVLMAFLCFNT